MRARFRHGRREVIRRLRRSALVTDTIPPALRVVDLAIVVLVTPLALVVGGVIALAVFLDSPGPVFYRSTRIGRGGRPFAMLKFRTMVRDADGPPLSCHGDERYTPLGRTLASSRLDELPQLVNVLRGEMRLVGPRPEIIDFVREFPDEYERILSVPPGLTGPSQVAYAWEGEILARGRAIDRARLYRESILPYKVRMDMDYAFRHSVVGDLRVLGLTALLPAVRIWHRLQRVAAGPRRSRLAAAAAVAMSVLVLAGLLAAESTTPF